MWKTLLAGLLLICAGAAWAEEEEDYSDLESKDPSTSIQRLHVMCSSSDKNDKLYCDGYITALVESLTAIGKEPLTREYGICPPASITTAESIQVFNGWAQRHPRQGTLMRNVGVAWALQGRWPCR